MQVREDLSTFEWCGKDGLNLLREQLAESGERSATYLGHP